MLSAHLRFDHPLLIGGTEFLDRNEHLNAAFFSNVTVPDSIEIKVASAEYFQMTSVHLEDDSPGSPEGAQAIM